MDSVPPTLFITLTCNTAWPEIKDGLARLGLGPSQYADAPLIVVRVFLCRMIELLSDAVSKCVNGRIDAYVGVVEFTTTFLPHFHLALIMDPADRPRTPDDIDSLVSAEIPMIQPMIHSCMTWSWHC